MADLFDRYRVIDMDTHVTEPPDVWVDRVSKKWGDKVPHIRRAGPKDLWFVGDTPIGAPGAYSAAGYDGTYPDFRDTYEDIPDAAYDARARLAMMDENGIHAEVLYPNVGGFGSANFLKLNEPELMLECVQAYNDFLLDWCSADPKRLLAVMALPFWDVELCVKEIERSAARGHRAILCGSQPQTFGQPLLRDPHWDPIWAAARETGLPISFHVGSGDLSEIVTDTAGIGTKANFARASSCTFVENWQCIADLIFGGVCHRFPEVNFVSVESGAGWLHTMLEMFDWQWVNAAVTDEHPEYDLMPSEYFRRQIYGSFWFESDGIQKALELLPDNLMYETDYPHPTCMSPGPKSSAVLPRVYAEETLGGLPEDTLRKVLHDTAAGLYGIE